MSCQKTPARDTVDTTGTQNEIAGLLIHAGKPLPVAQYTVKQSNEGHGTQRINLLLEQRMPLPFISSYMPEFDLFIVGDQSIRLWKPLIAVLRVATETVTGGTKIAIKYS